MSEIDFKDKFIGFVDILGFTKMVEASEAGKGFSASEIKGILQKLGTPDERAKNQKYGPTICPDSKYTQRNLDFRLTQVSDCAVVSTEVSPAGVINLVNHCWVAVIRLMKEGIMCRGYITRGLICHTEEDLFGTGYQEAYRKESLVTAFKRDSDERGTPFVEVDSAICKYIKNQTDSCVNEMFSRYVEDDGTVRALFPFKRLGHSFIVASGLPGYKFEPDKERESNNNMRLMIQKMKKKVMTLVDRENHDAVRKAQHYIMALDARLEMCNKTDETINMLDSAFYRKR